MKEELENMGYVPSYEDARSKAMVLPAALSFDMLVDLMEAAKQLNGKHIGSFESMEQKLFAPDTSLEEQKLLLVQLSFLDDVRAMRALERYVAACPAEVKGYAELLFWQSKLQLEASLLGEERMVFMSGMGGQGEKMRYFVGMLSLGRKPLTATQQQVVEKEVAYQLKQSGVLLERLSFEGCYTKVLALVPMTVEVQPLFIRCIDACNELGEFLEKNIVISTVKEFCAEELDKLTSGGGGPA